MDEVCCANARIPVAPAKDVLGEYLHSAGTQVSPLYLDINRGDQFDYLVSMSSNARGMHLKDPDRKTFSISPEANGKLLPPWTLAFDDEIGAVSPVSPQQTHQLTLSILLALV